MQKMDFTIEISEKEKHDTDALIQQLLADQMVMQYVTEHHIPVSVIRSHPWTMDEWRKQMKPCEKCRGLAFCKADIEGYQNMPVYDGILKKVQTPCRYKEAELTKRKHLANYLINDLPKSMETVLFDQAINFEENNSYIETFKKVSAAAENNTGIFLYGRLGVGKTYLAACAANEKAMQGIKVAFVYWPDFVQRMASMVISGEYRTEMDRLKYAKFAVIDDIGAESVTEWNRDQLLLPVLNARYEAGLTTWFTSNFNYETLLDHFRFSSKGDQADVKAERILDRIKALSSPEALTGKYRR